MYRRVWVPDGRAEPFFPLCPRRPCWIISPGTAAGLPPARIAAFATRGIIHRPSPPYELSSPANCWGSYPAVLFAAPAGLANLPHPRPLPRRRAVGGNGWVRCARHRRATSLCCASLPQYRASWRPSACSSCHSVQRTEGTAHEIALADSGPICADRTIDRGRHRRRESQRL